MVFATGVSTSIIAFIYPNLLNSVYPSTSTLTLTLNTHKRLPTFHNMESGLDGHKKFATKTKKKVFLVPNHSGLFHHIFSHSLIFIQGHR